MNETSEKEWNTGCLKFIGFLLIVATVLFLFILSAKQEKANRNNCEQVGGKYQVVGEEFVGKVTVDVYGCVK